jgi:hypothetical protein
MPKLIVQVRSILLRHRLRNTLIPIPVVVPHCPVVAYVRRAVDLSTDNRVSTVAVAIYMPTGEG